MPDPVPAPAIARLEADIASLRRAAAELGAEAARLRMDTALIARQLVAPLPEPPQPLVLAQRVEPATPPAPAASPSTGPSTSPSTGPGTSPTAGPKITGAAGAAVAGAAVAITGATQAATQAAGHRLATLHQRWLTRWTTTHRAETQSNPRKAAGVRDS